MPLKGLIVLIVEDEPIVGLALEDMLVDAGAMPFIAHTLDKARSLLDERVFHAAILDVNINGEHSYDLASLIANRSIPFIFATGYGASLHALAHAGVPTITKPYAFSEIERALVAVCQS